MERKQGLRSKRVFEYKVPSYVAREMLRDLLDEVGVRFNESCMVVMQQEVGSGAWSVRVELDAMEPKIPAPPMKRTELR